jgi:hypothetical protein
LDAIVYLVVVVVFAVIAVRIGMMLAPFVGRLSPADDAAETADAADDTEEPG